MTEVPRFDPWIVRAAIVGPSILAATQFLWTIAISHRLPTQIATHWDASGMPDGFMSPIQSALAICILTIACAQIGWTGATTKTPVFARTMMAVINLLLSGFLIGIGFAVIIPQLGATDSTTARIGWFYSILGATVGLIAGLLLARRLRDYSPLIDATVTEATSPGLPHREGPPTDIDVSVTYSIGVKIAIAIWAVVSLALAFFLPALGIIFLLCTPVFLLAYETGMRLEAGHVIADKDAKITLCGGFGPAKITHHIPLRTIKYAEPGKYHWADGGGIGLRFGNDGRITFAARSGESVRIETSGANYTVVVPNGMAATVAGEINSRLDAMRVTKG